MEETPPAAAAVNFRSALLKMLDRYGENFSHPPKQFLLSTNPVTAGRGSNHPVLRHLRILDALGGFGTSVAFGN